MLKNTFGGDAQLHPPSDDTNSSPTKTIELTNGGCCTVDAADYEELSRYRWSGSARPNGKTYVVRYEYRAGTRDTIYLHRHILAPAKAEIVDHIDGDPLNNSRSNLRITDRAGNARNRQKGKAFKSRPLSSPYKGVTWDRHASSWKAQITCSGMNHHLGRFKQPLEAARAYDRRAAELFGDFALPNFAVARPTGGPSTQDAFAISTHQGRQAA